MELLEAVSVLPVFYRSLKTFTLPVWNFSPSTFFMVVKL